MWRNIIFFFFFRKKADISIFVWDSMLNISGKCMPAPTFFEDHNNLYWDLLFSTVHVLINLPKIPLCACKTSVLYKYRRNLISTGTYSSKSRLSPFWIVVCHFDTKQFSFTWSDFLLISFSIVSALIDPFIWAWSSWKLIIVSREM